MDRSTAIFVDGLGAAAATAGILSQLQGRIFALLYLQPRPVALEDIAAELDQSKSNVSVNIRGLVESTPFSKKLTHIQIVWMRSTNEAPEHGAHLSALANPRAHPRLPARGCVGAAGGRRPGRLPSAGAADRLVRPVAKFLLRRPHALRDPAEARGAPRLGRRRRRPRLQGPDATRAVAGGSARRPVRPGVRRASFHLAVSDGRRVGGRVRQPDHARGT